MRCAWIVLQFLSFTSVIEAEKRNFIASHARNTIQIQNGFFVPCFSFCTPRDATDGHTLLRVYDSHCKTSHNTVIFFFITITIPETRACTSCPIKSKSIEQTLDKLRSYTLHDNNEGLHTVH